MLTSRSLRTDVTDHDTKYAAGDVAPSAADPPPPPPVTSQDSNSTVIRIAPDRIKDEISKAIQSGSFSKTNTLSLSDFHGNDIKIQIRIRNPDEMRASSATSGVTSGASGGSSSSQQAVIKRPRIVPISRSSLVAASSSYSSPSMLTSRTTTTSQSPVKYHHIAGPSTSTPVVRAAASTRASASSGALGGGGGGRFIKVASTTPGSGARNIVIQSSQIRTKVSPRAEGVTDEAASVAGVAAAGSEFTPIMKVEKVS